MILNNYFMYILKIELKRMVNLSGHFLKELLFL